MRHWALIAAAYLVGSLIFLWPMPSALDSAVWGDRFDAWTTLWLIGHLAEGMEAGTLSAHTTEILYPVGYSLWSFGHVALQAIGALLASATFDPPAPSSWVTALDLAEVLAVRGVPFLTCHRMPDSVRSIPSPPA